MTFSDNKLNKNLKYWGELKVLQYFGNVNSVVPNAIGKVVIVTIYTIL